MTKSSAFILIMAMLSVSALIRPTEANFTQVPWRVPNYSLAPSCPVKARFIPMKRDENDAYGELALPRDHVSGLLTIIAMPDPDPEKLYGTSSGANPEIDLGDLNAKEWEAIFYGVLHCPVAADEPFLSNETDEDWQVRFSQKFQQAIPKYPKLAEIWNLEIYISYEFEEVRSLRRECINLRDSTSNNKATASLAKLIKACDIAIKYKYGLLFIPE
jgi:hypothetical protein